ncbi:hypothetical protein [Roseimicrobium gellanilyticum]|nr:hypothetical protein [Roseimicrobium gellanilyticum]
MSFPYESLSVGFLALAAETYVSLGVLLAGASVVCFVFCWFLLSTSKVFDGLKRFQIQTCDFGKLRVIKEHCKVNELTMRRKLSCYQDGQMMILCHEPLPLGIGKRCWRIPLSELKPRGDAVYDFAIATPKGPLLCFFGQQFRKQFMVPVDATKPKENSPLGAVPAAVSSIGARQHQ